MGFSAKEMVRTALRSGVNLAPYGVRRALIQGMAEGGADTGFGLAQFAKAAGVLTCMASGREGLIQGSSRDEVIIPIYGASKTWAPATVEFISQALADGGTYLDIGANIGLTTIPVARNPKVRCIAFEPDPTNFKHLSENVRRNCLHGNVELLQKAVMEKPGKAALGLNDEGNPGDHRLIRTSTDRETVEVDGVSVDDMFSDIILPLAVKIDTQGAEPFVIAGARSTFAKAAAIVLEFWPYGMDKMGSPPEEVLSLIRGFRTVKITKGDSEQSEIFNPEDAVSVLSHYIRDAKTCEGKFWDVYLSR